MNTNIAEQTNKEISDLRIKLGSRGFRQEDHLLKKMMTGKEVFLSFYPKLLSYEDMIVPWICVKIECNSPLDYTGIKSIADVFAEIGVVPFRDEDAGHASFATLQVLDGSWHIYRMYVNPDYPMGYWENHALPHFQST